MSVEIKSAAETIFAYATEGRDRSHGPSGYTRPASFKPWLRDEFSFRCIYCRCRETWDANGHRAFSVEHTVPRSVRQDLACVYENLLYACTTCNSSRGSALLPLDPLADPLGLHVQMSEDGVLSGLTPDGQELIELCQLNRQSLVAFRLRLKHLVSNLLAQSSAEASKLLQDVLAFPENLPNLAVLRPPGGNSRPDSVFRCWFEQREQGTLPAVY